MSKQFIQAHTNLAFSHMRANRKRSSEQEDVLKKIQEDLAQEQLALKMQQENFAKEIAAFKVVQKHVAYVPPPYIPPPVQEVEQVAHNEDDVALTGSTGE